MAVFLRHRFAGVKTTIWKKYTVKYSSNSSSQASKDANETMIVYSAYDFPAGSANPTLTGRTNFTVTSSSASKFRDKLTSYGYIYSALWRSSARAITYYYYPVTAETARSLAIAGDYIEDVESEDPNAYPDNGPLGLYFYIKQ